MGYPQAHDRFVEDYNAQAHFAHAGRDDGRRSPAEVLGFASGVRHREEDLHRAFFSTRFVRVLDALGYTRFRHWKIHGEETLAGREAALWLAAEIHTLFENSIVVGQLKLFDLIEILAEEDWLKAVRLADYALCHDCNLKKRHHKAFTSDCYENWF